MDFCYPGAGDLSGYGVYPDCHVRVLQYDAVGRDRWKNIYRNWQLSGTGKGWGVSALGKEFPDPGGCVDRGAADSGAVFRACAGAKYQRGKGIQDNLFYSGSAFHGGDRAVVFENI